MIDNGRASALASSWLKIGEVVQCAAMARSLNPPKTQGLLIVTNSRIIFGSPKSSSWPITLPLEQIGSITATDKGGNTLVTLNTATRPEIFRLTRRDATDWVSISSQQLLVFRSWREQQPAPSPSSLPAPVAGPVGGPPSAINPLAPGSKRRRPGCLVAFLCIVLLLVGVIVAAAVQDANKSPEQKAKEKASEEAATTKSLTRYACQDFADPWQQAQNAINGKNSGVLTEVDMVTLLFDSAASLSKVATEFVSVPISYPIQQVAEGFARVRVDWINGVSTQEDFAAASAAFEQVRSMCVAAGAWSP